MTTEQSLEQAYEHLIVIVAREGKIPLVKRVPTAQLVGQFLGELEVNYPSATITTLYCTVIGDMLTVEARSMEEMKHLPA